MIIKNCYKDHIYIAISKNTHVANTDLTYTENSVLDTGLPHYNEYHRDHSHCP